MADSSRLKLKIVEAVPIENGQWLLNVSIGFRDRVYLGQAIAVSEEAKFEAVALATVEAINQILPPNLSIRLADLGQLSSTRVEVSVFVVIIELLEAAKSGFISGTSVLYIPILYAPAKAVLNAINRRITKYLAASGMNPVYAQS